MLGADRTLSLLYLLALFSLAASVAAQQPPPTELVEREYVEPLTEPLAVIPPGREDLLAEMLGRGETLPGACTFASGQVDRDTVIGTYNCPAGAAVVTLRHPGKAASGATLTEQFALSVQSGSPPAELVGALATRVRAREGAFEWTWLQPTAAPQSSRMFVVVAVLAAAVLYLVLRRRRRPPTP
jgi:hypothetical protein